MRNWIGRVLTNTYRQHYLPKYKKKKKNSVIMNIFEKRCTPITTGESRVSYSANKGINLCPLRQTWVVYPVLFINLFSSWLPPSHCFFSLYIYLHFYLYLCIIMLVEYPEIKWFPIFIDMAVPRQESARSYMRVRYIKFAFVSTVCW
jgi:hypothetical protein